MNEYREALRVALERITEIQGRDGGTAWKEAQAMLASGLDLVADGLVTALRAAPTRSAGTISERLIAAIEGECDGLGITEKQASNILECLQYGAPVAVCCGRKECGGECGNEWQGMTRAAPPAPVSQYAEGYADAVEIIAVYVEEHCVDGEIHANAVRTMLRPSAAPVSRAESKPDTGWDAADAIIGRLMSSDPDFEDCTAAATFIYRMVHEHAKGPDGYPTWKDAAIAERAKRLNGRIDERVPYMPYLSDRADGCKGHYAIARWVPDRDVREVWNLRRHHWAAFSDEVLTLEQATELLRKLVIPSAPLTNEGGSEPVACERCGGSKFVDDGEMNGIGGVEFENGPIQCVKDCPDCASPEPGPVLHSEYTRGWQDCLSLHFGQQSTAPQPIAKTLTDERRGELELIAQCDPSWVIFHLKENTAFDTPLIEKMFALGREHARAILADQSRDVTKMVAEQPKALTDQIMAAEQPKALSDAQLLAAFNSADSVIDGLHEVLRLAGQPSEDMLDA
jgi:hypothetical protein